MDYMNAADFSAAFIYAIIRNNKTMAKKVKKPRN